MPNTLAEIQAQIEAYLNTNPASESVETLIETLKEYKDDRDRALVNADLEWKDQLPENFTRHNKTREQFRRIYNQLKTQGISVTFSDDFSDAGVMQWILEGNGDKGRLMLYKRGKEWAMHGLKIQDEKGNSLLDFDFIYYATIVTSP
jgi:hypothetical protein